MTNDDKRFTAAVAVMQGIYANWDSPTAEDFIPTDQTPPAMAIVAKISIMQADALLARLDETAPISPTSEYVKCEDGHHVYAERIVCTICNERLQ